MTSRKPSANLDAGVHDTAARWVARLALGDASREEVEELKAWLHSDPEHRQAFDEVRTTWAELSSQEQPKQRSWPPGRGLRVGGLAAACLALAIGLPQLFSHELSSPTGSVRQVQLADGSQLWLDSDAAADFHVDANGRSLDLARGRVHIAVAPDSSRPFKVMAAGYEIHDIGTAFSVNAEGGGLRVSVTEGSVEVRKNLSTTSLVAGRAASFEQETASTPRRFDTALEAQWRTGQIALERTTLAEALHEVDRYLPGKVLLLDATAGQRMVTGRIAMDDIQGGLDALAVTQRLKLVRLPFLVIVTVPK